jgi:hypothetical protein
LNQSQAWQHIPVIPALRRRGQEDGESETSWAYMVKPCLKTTKMKREGWRERERIELRYQDKTKAFCSNLKIAEKYLNIFNREYKF